MISMVIFLIQTADGTKAGYRLLYINMPMNNGSANANDALNNKLIDGLKYDDEVKDEIKEFVENR